MTLTEARTDSGEEGLKLEEAQSARLRETFPFSQDEAWVQELAQQQGWLEANRQYLAWHLARGRLEMAALMGELGLESAPNPATAVKLVQLAYHVFMPAAAFKGRVEPMGEDAVRITVDVCPTYEKIEGAGWHGVTACGSWHHRRGWYEAMGVEADDSLIAEQKWGEPACVAEVRFRAA